MILIIVGVAFRRNKLAKKLCPKCQQPFGKSSVDNMSAWYDPRILDGTPFRNDGYRIHCDKCNHDFIFDTKGKLLENER